MNNRDRISCVRTERIRMLQWVLETYFKKNEMEE